MSAVVAADDLTQVVGRDVRRHSDRNPGRSVDEEVRDTRGKDGRLVFASVEVGRVVDGLLLDVGQQLRGERHEPRLGVAVRRRRVAIDGAEVALPVDERIAQGEVLHHAHHRVVDGRIAVRVVLTEHVTDHGRALLVRAARREPRLGHRVQNASVDRLETVTDVREGPLYDDAHRVVDERLPHLVFEEPREDRLPSSRTAVHRELVAHTRRPSSTVLNAFRDPGSPPSPRPVSASERALAEARRLRRIMDGLHPTERGREGASGSAAETGKNSGTQGLSEARKAAWDNDFPHAGNLRGGPSGPPAGARPHAIATKSSIGSSPAPRSKPSMRSRAPS